MTAPETVILISTVTSGIVSIMNTYFNKRNKEELKMSQEETKGKLAEIHEQTNGGWAAAHQQLSLALAEISSLKEETALLKKTISVGGKSGLY